VRTFSPKPSDVQRAWHLVDAEGLVLGRMSSEVARLLRGKHKPVYAPHLDTGDHVIVVNASKVVLTSGKEGKKVAYRHSGYPGGLKQRSYTDIMANNPENAVRKAVRGMLPKGPLGRSMIKKLKIYAGPTHPHAAQLPEPLALVGALARQRGL
jgi:large subunit ribosomal protein L13